MSDLIQGDKHQATDICVPAKMQGQRKREKKLVCSLRVVEENNNNNKIYIYIYLL